MKLYKLPDTVLSIKGNASGFLNGITSNTLDTPLNAAAQLPRNTKPAYDGLTEIWWDKAEDLVQALSSPEGQRINGLLAEDEARFCDVPNCAVFFAEEHTIF